MKISNKIFGLVLLLCINSSFASTLINLEEAAEVTNLKLRLDNKNSALIYARICDNCELLTLRAGSNTQIKRGNRALSLKEAAALKNKGATVLFDPSTSQVTRILFWN